MSRRAALACFAGLAVTACRPGSLRTLRVGSVPRGNIAPLYVADELGFFRAVGLAIDVHLLSETTQTVPLLAASRIDVSLSGATPALFNAIAQGARTRVVAGREIAAPGCTRELYGNRRSFPNGFERASQLKGKRVAVTSPTSVTAFLLDVVLESAGSTTADERALDHAHDRKRSGADCGSDRRRGRPRPGLLLARAGAGPCLGEI